MSIPEPKFAVGECVMVRSVDNPSINSDRSVVTYRQYMLSQKIMTGELLIGWGYLVDTHERYDSHGRIFLLEQSLRKRPEPGQDWESLRDGLKLPQVETA